MNVTVTSRGNPETQGVVPAQDLQPQLLVANRVTNALGSREQTIPNATQSQGTNLKEKQVSQKQLTPEEQANFRKACLNAAHGNGYVPRSGQGNEKRGDPMLCLIWLVCVLWCFLICKKK